MTYDIALWKARAKNTDSSGLIALTLNEGYESKAISRFPKSKVVNRLEEIFGCSADELPFEATITGQGAIFGLPYGEGCENQREGLAQLARELDLSIYDFQENSPSEADVAEFQRRVRDQGHSEDEQAFVFALEAAGKGSLYHQHLVGSCYRNGTGVKKDLSEAAEWYERAANAGMTKALVSLAEMCREDIGDDASLNKGLGYLQRAVSMGSSVGMAMLAEWKRDGIGAAKDIPGAIGLWRRLVEVDAFVAAFELARAYEHGAGVEQSTKLAIDYYRTAREAGHPEAWKNLRRLGAET
jgi:TPR repeat protein